MPTAAHRLTGRTGRVASGSHRGGADDLRALLPGARSLIATCVLHAAMTAMTAMTAMLGACRARLSASGDVDELGHLSEETNWQCIASLILEPFQKRTTAPKTAPSPVHLTARGDSENNSRARCRERDFNLHHNFRRVCRASAPASLNAKFTTRGQWARTRVRLKPLSGTATIVAQRSCFALEDFAASACALALAWSIQPSREKARLEASAVQTPDLQNPWGFFCCDETAMLQVSQWICKSMALEDLDLFSMTLGSLWLESARRRAICHARTKLS